MGKVMVLKCAAVTTLFWAVAAGSACALWDSEPTGALKILIFGIGSVSLICGMFGLDIVLLNPADSHTLISLLQQYFMSRIGLLIGYFMERKFNKCATDLRKTQKEVLLRILQQNNKTVFGEKHRFSEIKSREDFTASVPVSSFFPDYENYIERMSSGEENVLTSSEVRGFSVSSGTTGKAKRIPFTSQTSSTFLKTAVFLKYLYKNIDGLKRTINLRYKPRKTYTSGGHVTQPISFFLAPPAPSSVVPSNVISKISGAFSTEYVSALFSLAEHELQYLDTMLSTNCYCFFKLIEKEADSLCHDIATGRIGEHVDIDDDIRDAINRRLTPNPSRASIVKREIARGKIGLAKRLWPHLKHVGMVSSGTFSTAARFLESTYIKGIHHHSYVHISSEATLGFTLDCKTPEGAAPSYACTAHVVFFEYIPEEEIHSKNPTTLFIDQIKQGESYEMVVTTGDGLYRYRMGDVIKVVGFHKECPVYTFQYRTGHCLNVRHEKTTEENLRTALTQLQQSWSGPQIVEYTATESINVDTLKCNNNEVDEEQTCRYVVFMETQDAEASYFVSKSDEDMLDGFVCQAAPVYSEKREEKAISQLEIIQVKSGTFAKVKALLTDINKNYQQFKMPRVMHKAEVLSLLLRHRVDSNTSDGHL